MNVDINNAEARTKICGIVVLVGAASCSISLFTLVRYAFRGESPYAFALLIRNLACIAGFIVISVGVFADKHHLFKLGLFASAAAFVIDAYFPLMWIDSDRKYYGSLSEGLGGGNLILLLCYLTALAGFLFTGILFSQKPAWQFPKVGSLGMICIAAFVLFTVGYTIYYIKDNYLTLWEYASSYIPSSSLLSMIGAIGVLLMPIVFSNEIPKVDILEKINTNKPNTQINITDASESDAENAAESVGTKMIEGDTINLLRRYKELLDMGIITDEEFQLKKSELLK